jgi:hypothetical protein
MALGSDEMPSACNSVTMPSRLSTRTLMHQAFLEFTGEPGVEIHGREHALAPILEPARVAVGARCEHDHPPAARPYERLSASGSRARKKNPPIPVTRATTAILSNRLRE